MKNPTDEIDYKARQIFQNRINRGMIGPGSDTWGLPDEEEIISDYPLPRYFSGVLFPNKSVCPTQSAQDDADGNSEGLEDDVDVNEENPEVEEVDIEEKDVTDKTVTTKEEFNLSTNSFFPTNIGVTVAVEKSVNEIDVEFSFGLYHQPKNEELKIKIPKAGYDSFFEEGIPYPLPFRNILKYSEDGFMYLERELKGEQRRPQRANGEYGQYDEFKRTQNLTRQTEEGGYFSAYYYIGYLDKLLSRSWKRKQYNFKLKVPIVKSTPIPEYFQFEDEIFKQTRAGYNIKIFEDSRAKYIKVQLVNLSDDHPANRFSNRSENLNLKSLFQGKIKVHSEKLIEYKDNTLSTYTAGDDIRDFEAEEIEFIYRNIKSYGIGHNCSVSWDIVNKTVETTFLPQQDIKDVINEFEDSSLDDCLDMRNLSIWGVSKEQLKSNLRRFVVSYKEWIEKQLDQKSKLSKNEQEIATRIIDRQQANYNRLNNNIDLLDNEDIYEAFKLANTAMLIQFIVANDSKLGKYEKELHEVDKSINANHLEFFKNYDAIKGLGFISKYRPFQLAFLLLSIEEIAIPEKRQENSTVDLIWFPTGGGKTEAYLAVAAFTIAYRRISKSKDYGGTTVMMRYTLRLLTAQQFERASRLIATLEFLREQKEFTHQLKDEPITIGLWVGQASTPNKISDAKKLLDDKYGMEAEALKGKDGDPSKKNEFQISSCPWCGTKLVSQEKKQRVS